MPRASSLSVAVRGWLLDPIQDQIAALRRELMASEAENYAKLTATVADVKTAFTSLQTENAQLREALEAADADAVRRVDEALAADSEHDAAAIEAVDASLREIVPGQPVEVPVEGGGEEPTGGETPVEPAPVDPEAPADGGNVEVPSDGTQPNA